MLSLAEILIVVSILSSGFISGACQGLHIDNALTVRESQFTLTSEWIEIPLEDPFECGKDKLETGVRIVSPIVLEPGSTAIVLRDGTRCSIEVVLTFDTGVEYILSDLHLIMGKSGNFALFSAEELPRGGSVRSMRMRSDRPLECDKVVVRCYDFHERR